MSHMQNRSAKRTAARDCHAVADLREAAPLQCARKRLRCKTTVEHVGAALPLSQVNSVGGSVIKFDWKTRRHAEQQYAADWMRRHKCSSGTYWSRRDAGRAAFRSLSEDKQQPWIDDAVQHFLRADDQDGCTPAKRGCVRNEVPAALAHLPATARAVGCLLTWNGTWCAECPDVRAAFSEHTLSVDALVCKVSGSQSCQSLMQNFWQCMERQCQAMGFFALHVRYRDFSSQRDHCTFALARIHELAAAVPWSCASAHLEFCSI